MRAARTGTTVRLLSVVRRCRPPHGCCCAVTRGVWFRQRAVTSHATTVYARRHVYGCVLWCDAAGRARSDCMAAVSVAVHRLCGVDDGDAWCNMLCSDVHGVARGSVTAQRVSGGCCRRVTLSRASCVRACDARVGSSATSVRAAASLSHDCHGICVAVVRAASSGCCGCARGERGCVSQQRRRVDGGRSAEAAAATRASDTLPHTMQSCCACCRALAPTRVDAACGVATAAGLCVGVERWLLTRPCVCRCVAVAA
jgi:hypothetical protein